MDEVAVERGHVSFSQFFDLGGIVVDYASLAILHN
jgi:hypothetical protein